MDNSVSQELDRLIEENNKKVLELAIKSPNKQNKALIVKCLSDNSTKTFDSILETVRYYETQGIKLDRKSNNRSIEYGGFIKNIHSNIKKTSNLSLFLITTISPDRFCNTSSRCLE